MLLRSIDARVIEAKIYPNRTAGVNINRIPHRAHCINVSAAFSDTIRIFSARMH